MKALDVVIRLMDRLPRYTSQFSDSVSVTSISAVGNLATAVTATPHGRSTNDLVNITGTFAPVSIASLTRLGENAEIVTNTDHDLTEGYYPNVSISGFNEVEFNGNFVLSQVLNRRRFIIKVDNSGAANGTGSGLLLNGSAYGYNGLKQITVIDPTTFTYNIDVNLPLPAVGNINAFTSHRITASATIERFLDAYTQQQNGQEYACVVLGEVTASRDRNTINDAAYTAGTGQAYYQKVIQPFGVYVVSSVSNERAARNKRDEMEDIFRHISRSLVGFRFDTGLAANKEFMTTFISHGMNSYDGAVYVHEFLFEQMAQFTYSDTVGEDFNVAFRDIHLYLDIGLDLSDDIVLIDMDDDINLDKEVL